MPIGISVGDAPAELRAAVLAMKRLPKEITKIISADMRGVMGPEWKAEVNQHLTGSGRKEGKTLTAGVRIAAGNPPTLIAASSVKRYGSGGRFTSNDAAPGWEFGSHGTKVSKVTNSKGTTFERHTTRHLPAYKKSGRVVYPAAAAILPRVAAYWVESIVRATLDAVETRS